MPPQYHGPNAELVLPVLEIANAGFTLATKSDPSLRDATFVSKLEEAFETCFDQEHGLA